MKKMVADRYPHSATLFRFCKEALTLRHGGQVKVIDQDVGALLSFDPADCSHWKKGRKNIRSLDMLRLLSTQFQINEQVLIDIVAGRITLDEALLDLNDYKVRLQHSATRNVQGSDLLRKKLNTDKTILIRSRFRDIAQTAQVFLRHVRFSDTTIDFHNLKTHITVQPDPHLATVTQTDRQNGQTIIRYRGEQWQGHTRFLVLREVCKELHRERCDIFSAFFELTEDDVDAIAHTFAAQTLVPTDELRHEMHALDPSKNVIEQLAEKFGLPKTLMNQRIQSYFHSLTQ